MEAHERVHEALLAGIGVDGVHARHGRASEQDRAPLAAPERFAVQHELLGRGEAVGVAVGLRGLVGPEVVEHGDVGFGKEVAEHRLEPQPREDVGQDDGEEGPCAATRGGRVHG